MSPGPHPDQVALRERALLEALSPVAAELRLIDVANFIADIQGEKFANIKDIVHSSIELFFKPETLFYGGGAECEVDWDRAPTIILDMEFRHRSIWVVFKLIIGGSETRGVIEHASFGAAAANAQQETQRLLEAIAEARTPMRGH